MDETQAPNKGLPLILRQFYALLIVALIIAWTVVVMGLSCGFPVWVLWRVFWGNA